MGLQVSEVVMTYNSAKSAYLQFEKITSSNDAYEALRALWSDDINMVESFCMLMLNASNQITGFFVVAKGGLSAVHVDARVIFSAALTSLAAGIIVAHNHPSGNLQPSSADRAITKSLVEGGKILNIPVLDHIILSPEGGFYSFADNNEM